MRALFSRTDWALSDLDDIRSWLPSLSPLTPTCELTMLSYDIRHVGELLTNFDETRVLDEERPLSDHEETSPPSSLPNPPLAPSSSPITHPKRIIRKQALTMEPVGDAAAENEPLRESDISSAPQPASSIRVQRPSRAKKTSEDMNKAEAVQFPVKVRLLFLILCLSLF